MFYDRGFSLVFYVRFDDKASQPAFLVRARPGFDTANSGSLALAEVWEMSGALLEVTQDPRARPEHRRSSAASA